jgi:hypothetical protein
MKTLIIAVCIVLAVVLALFILSFLVYFFNLDMKLMAALEPYLNKIYDKRKRERRL